MKLPRRVRRPSHATIVAYLALFAALGGGAYAAKLAQKNSVNSRAIIDGQVRARDLRRGAVSGAKIANGAVGGVKIGSGQVAKRHLQAAQAWRVVKPLGGSLNSNSFCQDTRKDLPSDVFLCSHHPGGPPDFNSAWANDPPTFNYDVAYYKDPYGQVHLRGVAAAGPSANVTTRDAIFRLPPGYRPSKELSLGTATGYGPALIAVQRDGYVVAAQGNYGGIALDGISFRACGEPGAERC